MKDPIKIYENLKMQYFKYIDTTYTIDNEALRSKRKELYLSDEHKILAQEPYLELIKPYPSSGTKISDISFDQIKKSDGTSYFSDEAELKLFKDFCLSGLVGDFPLYAHQIEMLQRYAEGKNCIITTGTGSGKTESFLLPLFAYLAKNLNKWRNNEEKSEAYNWFSIPIDSTRTQKRKGKTVGGNPIFEPRLQRNGSIRNSALKAIIIYPMNALVDDQMTRLRKALDSEAAESFYTNSCNKHRIFFGQYNGATPISGELNSSENKTELAIKINTIKKTWDKIVELTQQPNFDLDEKEDLLYSFQKVGGSELLSRFDIQGTPPDILITNYSMLNIMLMRDREDNIFIETKKWLEEDATNNIFHIIVDELHLNRGSSGTELALLLRLIEERLGLYPGHPQLRVLASSASLDPNDEQSKKYITDFFGMDFDTHFKIVKEERGQDELIEVNIDSNLLIDFYNRSVETNVEIDDETLATDIFGEKFLENKFNQISQMLRRGFENVDGKHTLSLSAVKNKLFGADVDDKALRGLLLLRALYNDDKFNKIKRDLPRIRFHLFFKNIDALYTKAGEIDALQLENNITKVDGHKVLQNLYCDECGTLFYGGRRLERNGSTEILPMSSTFESMPDLNLDQRLEYLNYDEYVVFWPSKLLVKELNTDAAADFQTAYSVTGKWKKANLDVSKGLITREWKQENTDGYVFLVIGADTKTLAFPCQCPQCAQTYKDKQFRKSPIRTFKTGYSAVSQALASNLLRQLSPNDPDNRKLLIFSDSRSAAADISNQLERVNYNDALRKNFFRLGLFQSDTIVQDLLAFHNNNDPACWNWNSLTEIQKTFCEANISNPLVTALKVMNRQGFKDLLTIQLNSLNVEIGNVIPISNLLPSTQNNEPNILFKEFIIRGINPVGNDIKMQNQGQIHWSQIYNLTTGGIGENMDGQFHSILAKEFSEKICAILFGRSQFSIETMAKGFVSFPQNQIENIFTKLTTRGVVLNNDLKSLITNISNTFLRILGNKYRHVGTDFEPTGNHPNFDSFTNLTSDYKTYFENVFEVNSVLGNIDKTGFVNDILNVLNVFNPPKQFILSYNQNIPVLGNPFQPFLNPKYFDLTLVNRTDTIYVCGNCGANHAHFSGGVCALCFNALDINNTKIAEDIWKINYYSSEDEAIRIHCEELTGQTDPTDAKARQRAFKNIFIDIDGQNKIDRKAEQIDALSVTTTMEVGVDIGSLEATLLANMPPERYNYQQRVGRAGRGGQAYSIALTLCRGNSHDSYYYHHLDGMINAAPPTPFIPMEENSDISKRMFHKMLLRRVFREMGIHNSKNIVVDGRNKKVKTIDNHGEFGWREDFEGYDTFIDACNFVLQDQCFTEFVSTHLNFTDFPNGEQLRTEILGNISGLDCPPEGLAESLAESGMLPMYGMPTRVRVLYHDYKNGKYSEMSRDLDMSISEYAPGSEVTKDKRVFEVNAITAPIMKGHTNSLTQYEEPIGGNTFYYDKLTNGTVTIDNDIDHTIAHNFKLGIRPKAYIASFYAKDKGNSQKPYFSLTIPRIVAGNEDVDWAEVPVIVNAVQYLHQGQIYSFNENQYQAGFRFGTPTNIFQNNDNLKMNKLLKESEVQQMERDGIDISDIHSYNLASNKTTALLQIRPKESIANIQLTFQDLPDSLAVFRTQGVKAAIYSAAFILRTVYTQHQDINDSELDVLGLRIYETDNGSLVTGFAYADLLPNGSGFTQKLSENLSEYLQLCLEPTGIIAEKSSPYIQHLLSVENQEKCDAADYTNLLNYRNKRFHPLLNWRLGIGFLRILKGNDNDIIGILNANPELPEFGKYYGKDSWLQGVAKQLIEFAEEYSIKAELIDDYTLPYLQYKGDYKKLIIPTHPLWAYDSIDENLLIQEVKNGLVGYDYIYIDTFNLTNRPGDCYEKLVQGVQYNDGGNFALLM